jgi:parallel beta-helix repeat protein
MTALQRIRLIVSAITAVAAAAIMLLVLRPPSAALADPTLLFVRPNADGDCSMGDPCSLHTAVISASDSDIIYMSAGVYTGTLETTLNLTKSISLYGGWNGLLTKLPIRHPEMFHTIIDGEGTRTGVRVFGNYTVTLDGLRIANCQGGLLGGGVLVYFGQITINNCWIYGNTATNHGGGIFVGSAGSVSLTGSQVFSNTSGWTGAGIYVGSSPSSTLSGNTIYSNTSGWGSGLHVINSDDSLLADNFVYRNRMDADVSSCGILVENCTNVSLVNNMAAENEYAGTGGGSMGGICVDNSRAHLLHSTIARNDAGEGNGIMAYDGATVWMTNTILVSHTAGINVDATSAVSLNTTLWGSGAWANLADRSGAGTVHSTGSDIRQLPAFVDPDHVDYHITSTSAAINAGIATYVSTDIDGESRPDACQPDIGADEYNSGLQCHNAYLPLVLRDS